MKKYSTALSGFPSSIRTQMRKSRSVRDEDYDPKQEATQKRKRQRSRRRKVRKQENLKQSKHQIKKKNREGVKIR